MKHLFVPYDIALMAKEKGFNEPCFGVYNSKGELYIGTEYSSPQHHLTNAASQAPLNQQLVDWFREKHDIWIGMEFGSEFMPLYVIGHDGSPRKIVNSFGSSYYECLNYAIKEAFKIIKVK